MLIGVPKEIKPEEYRVGLVPATVRELVDRGHCVEVETHAGEGAGISDGDYVAAGAQIVGGPQQIFREAELVVKVKRAAGRRTAAAPPRSGHLYLSASGPRSAPGR